MARALTLISLALASCSLSFAAEPSPVIVQPLKTVAFVDEVEALGTLKADESVDVMATVTERVIKVNFSDGQRVKQGDLLIEMDSVEEKAQLAEEQSRLKEALKQVDRLKPLAKKNAATQSTLDQQLREVETARARMQAIQSRINERVITAPFDGVMGLRNISVGAIVQPGKVIATIDDDRKMKLDFSVPELFLNAVSPGVEIVARTRAFPDQLFNGEVVSIDTRIDPVTRSVVVRALLENPQALLRPGLLMRVALKANPRDVLVIQEESLVSSATRNFVYRVSEQNGSKVAQRVEVRLGERRKGEVEVLEGLNVGDQIVVHGVNRLKDGQPVIVKAVETNNETLQQMLQSSSNSNGQGN